MYNTLNSYGGDNPVFLGEGELPSETDSLYIRHVEQGETENEKKKENSRH